MRLERYRWKNIKIIHNSYTFSQESRFCFNTKEIASVIINDKCPRFYYSATNFLTRDGKQESKKEIRVYRLWKLGVYIHEISAYYLISPDHIDQTVYFIYKTMKKHLHIRYMERDIKTEYSELVHMILPAGIAEEFRNLTGLRL